jgi:hypothetical protein
MQADATASLATFSNTINAHPFGTRVACQSKR